LFGSFIRSFTCPKLESGELLCFKTIDEKYRYSFFFRGGGGRGSADILQLQCGHVPVSNISRYYQDAGGFSIGAVLGVVSIFVFFDSIEKFEFEHSRFF